MNVEYSKYLVKFTLAGWPDNVPFRQPSSLGASQLKKIWECKDEILFIPNVTAAQAVETVSTVNVDIEPAMTPNDEINGGEPSNEEIAVIIKNKSRAKAKSFVSKGDVIPVLAPEKGTSGFWLFVCSSKCKTNDVVNGRWLDRVGETTEYRTLQLKATTCEGCVLWNERKGCREVMASEDFLKNDPQNGIFILTHAAQSHLAMLAETQMPVNTII